MNTWKTSAFSLLILCLTGLCGCESLRQEVNPDRLNREADKLVVTSFLCPQDTLLAVKVSRSQPLLGENTGTVINVSDAVVTLSEGGRSVTLRYDAKLGYYQTAVSQLPIIAGQTYSLVVQTANGERATSTCTIPAPVSLSSITLDSLTENEFGRQIKRYFVRARWQDPADQINSYQVTGAFRFVATCLTCINNSSTNQEQIGSLYFDDNTNGLQIDRNTNGGAMISGRAFFGIYFSSNIASPDFNFGDRYKSASILINLLSTDQAYYQYQDAVARQSQVSGNPFAEPVPIPSNIQGALGCFGAYNRSTLTMTLK